MKTLTEKTFDAHVVYDPTPRADADDAVRSARPGPGFALVDFWAEWCSPCKVLAKTLKTVEANSQKSRERLAERGFLLTVGINFYSLDTEKYPAVASKYRVRSLPTLILFDSDGTPIGRLVGAADADAIEKFIEHSITKAGKK